MATYVIADIEIQNPGAMTEYLTAVPPIVRKHGGRYLVRGGKCETVEGDWKANSIVVLEFLDADAARAFLDDPEYSPWKAIRLEHCRTRGILVEGV
jgi:uncharacterized protein (DUF1330 family)